MREVWLLFQKGIKQKKGTIFGIFLFIFLLSITLTCAISLRVHYNQRVKEAVKEDGYFDAVFWVTNQKLEMSQITVDSMIHSLESNSDVAKVETMPYIGSSIRSVHGVEANNSILIQQMNSGLFHYTFFAEDSTLRTIEQNSIQLKKNEAAVPLSYVSSYHCKIGDKIKIGSKKSAPVLTVKAFFEDPYMGVSLMGIKTILVNQTTYTSLKEIADQNQDEKIKTGTLFNIAKKTDSKTPLTDFAFVRSLNKTSQISSYANFSLTKGQSGHYMLLLTDIFSGILIAFLLLILVITLIIIKHSIETSLELEYKDIGILKSIGVSESYILGYILMEYILGILLGEIAGMICAVWIVQKLMAMTRTTINLAVSTKIAYLPCVLIEGVILLVMICFIFLSLRKMNRIHPLQAIREGKESVYFKSRLQLPIIKKGLLFSIAYRQFIFSKKNYAKVSFIVAILFFFLIMVNGMAKWGSDGGKNIIRLFSSFDSDISITYQDAAIQTEVEDKIDKVAGLKKQFYGQSTYMMVDGVQMYVSAISDPKQYNTVYKGRTCKYDNEVLITQYVADELHKQIGDELSVSSGKNTYSYMISGIYECANDTGANIGMSMKGLIHLSSNDHQEISETKNGYTYEYQLKDVSKKAQLVTSLKHKYDKTKLHLETNDVFDSMSAVSYALYAIVVLIYVIALIFSLVTVAMVTGKIIRMEIKDYGIYKAIGYTSHQIRVQLAIRMGISAIFGNLIGVLGLLIFGKGLIAKLFEFMGVYHYSVEGSVVTEIVTFAGMIIFFMLMSMVFTRKVKKVSTKMLMNES